jgi:type III restriction enzyme
VSDAVAWWLRLYLDDPVWIGLDGSARYFPDFIVVDKASVHWLVEVKADSAAANDTSVAVKRAAAEEWARTARESKLFGEWRYLFVTESDIKASPTWEALISR